MSLTVQEFRSRWENDNPPITNNECAECAIAWGLTKHPKAMPIRSVVLMVLNYAGIKYTEEN